MKVPIGISARHIHLSKDNLKILFGANGTLTKYRDLTQEGEFACNEKLIIKTSKNKIENVRIIGPLREYTQVEISKTDAYFLGLNPPVRDSGDIENSSPITLIGPKGRVNLKEGCIIARRHIHLTKQDVLKYNLKNVSKVQVKVPGLKGGILNNVFLKVNNSYSLELHLDIDDANAHLINQGDIVEVIKPE